MGKRPKRISAREKAAAATVIEDVIETVAEETDIPYAFQSPESSTIVGAVYDPDTETLLTTFRHDDSTYRYDKVSVETWKAFLEAPSRGKFFATQLRPLYAGKKVE